MAERRITLFLSGDVMTGRGVDQIMPHAVAPTLYEACVHDARDYVRLAEQASGPIPRPVAPAYVWGDALGALHRLAPDVRVINLETAVTDGGAPWPGKGIHYRMHPRNVALLGAANINACVLANNHVLDWGEAGLRQTLATLKGAGVQTAGAGLDRDAAAAPAVLTVQDAVRVLVFAWALPDSGVPRAWAAEPGKAGVNYLPWLSDLGLRMVSDAVAAHAQPRDLVVLSIHWGSNWGHAISAAQRRFARRFIDEARVDLVHGHSSHHVKGAELHHGKLILYGCGDLLNDYEGIPGHETYRPDLALLYLPTLDATTGRLTALRLAPMRLQRMQLHRATLEDAHWLCAQLNRQSMGLRFEVDTAGDLIAQGVDESGE